MIVSNNIIDLCDDKTIARLLVPDPLDESIPAEHRKAFEAVREEARALLETIVPQRLEGTYSKIFKKRKSGLQTESVVHQFFVNKDVGATNITTDKDATFSFTPVESTIDVDAGQRFVFNAKNVTVRLGIPVESTNGVLDTVNCLVDAFKEKRETEAADVLNKATTYNPTIGGDGMPLSSLSHPHDKGVWSNTFYHQMDLNRESLETALKQIETSWFDVSGKQISANGVRLVVPPKLKKIAARLDFPHVAWGHMKNAYWWFVQTDIDGLIWYERIPFNLAVGIEKGTNKPFLVGNERRVFTYTDPHAVFCATPSDS